MMLKYSQMSEIQCVGKCFVVDAGNFVPIQHAITFVQYSVPSV